MKKTGFYLFLILLMNACSKDDDNKQDKDPWYEARVCYKENSNCENFMPIDMDDKPGTDFKGWPVNLPEEFKHTDRVCKVVFVKFEMLQDSFYCQRHSVGVGSPYFSFRKIELIDIKR